MGAKAAVGLLMVTLKGWPIESLIVPSTRCPPVAEKGIYSTPPIVHSGHERPVTVPFNAPPVPSAWKNEADGGNPPENDELQVAANAPALPSTRKLTEASASFFMSTP